MSGMTLEEIEKHWVKDCQIDKMDLASASLRIPKLHAKYYAILLREQKKDLQLRENLRELEYVLELLYTRKISDEMLAEYGLEFPDQKIMKPDVPKWIANHKDVISIKQEIGFQTFKIEYLRSILKECSNMSFQIRNAIEVEKFKAGIV